MFESTLDLHQLRRRALHLILAILWVEVPLVWLACWIGGTTCLIPVGAATLVAAIAQGFAKLDAGGDPSRILSGVGLMVSISILIGAMANQSVQVDLHMSYFAALAVLVACCDWRVIVAGTASVALHHIGLNFLLPDLIYPGGANVPRLFLHAVILVLEAAALAWIAHTIEQMFDAISLGARRADVSRAEAEQSTEAALSASKDAEAANRRNEEDRAHVMKEDEVILTSLAAALRRMAGGDLTFSLDAGLPKKVEALRSDLNATIQSLRSVMQSVSKSAGNVRASADEITTASDDLSRRTEQQAASLEQTAASLGEITATVKKTSEGAKHARDAVGTAKRDAEASSAIVRQAVDAMGEIERSSNQIDQIISVIDEIAFQTNLLALNAGVEAARAGDAGRGFAVVASEVRALAQRSAEAAKEIKVLINTSSAQVAAGVSLVAQTGTSLQGIMIRINGINDDVSEIAASAVDQATALDQINTAVVQMDHFTQQNADMVEEMTAASHSLSQEIEQLAQLVGQFKTGRGQSSEHTAPRKVQSRPSTLTVMTHTAHGRGGAAARKAASATAPADQAWQEF